MVTTEEYKRAERDLMRADWQRGWRIHAVIYTLVNAGLIALNVLLVQVTDSGFYWFAFPLVGWGIGLTFHYLHGVRWAEREIRERQRTIEQRATRSRPAT